MVYFCCSAHAERGAATPARAGLVRRGGGETHGQEKGMRVRACVCALE